MPAKRIATNGENYNLLAKTIVSEAADEYKRNRFILDTLELRSFKNSEEMEKARLFAQSEVDDIESFFKSEWFYTLSGIDGEKAFEALKETYTNEYVPMRLKAMEKKGGV